MIMWFIILALTLVVFRPIWEFYCDRDLGSIIDLHQYQKGSVFVGRTAGEAIRKSSRLDKMDKKFKMISIIIPNNIHSINPSFFVGLFEDAIRKNGRQKFHDKFKFISTGTYDYRRSLGEAINRTLRS